MNISRIRPAKLVSAMLAGSLALSVLIGPAFVPPNMGGSVARAEVSIGIDVFQRDLSPYGQWVDSPNYGQVWYPAGVRQGWRPYYDDGHWEYSDDYGWIWVSDLPWGWAAFHYGRWAFDPNYGWVWVPGYVWAPAWVSWRWVNGYACWAPMAPHGYVYPHAWPGWVVVPHTHFTAPIRRWAIPHAHSGVIVRSARPVPSFPSWRGRGPMMRPQVGGPAGGAHPHPGAGGHGGRRR